MRGRVPRPHARLLWGDGAALAGTSGTAGRFVACALRAGRRVGVGRDDDVAQFFIAAHPERCGGLVLMLGDYDLPRIACVSRRESRRVGLSLAVN